MDVRPHTSTALAKTLLLLFVMTMLAIFLDDPSIQPGETYVFKIHPGQVPAWEQSVREKSHPDASTIKAMIQMLSFGDGTGYFVNKPYPRDKHESATVHRQHIPS
jgi:hypothetical protein